MTTFAAPGQTAESCRSLADGYRRVAARIDISAETDKEPRRSKRLHIAGSFRRSADEWDRLADALARPVTADA